jgi:hypothetical protein
VTWVLGLQTPLAQKGPLGITPGLCTFLHVACTSLSGGGKGGRSKFWYPDECLCCLEKLGKPGTRVRERVADNPLSRKYGSSSQVLTQGKQQLS